MKINSCRPGLRFLRVAASSNNSMQRTALRAAADADMIYTLRVHIGLVRKAVDRNVTTP